MKLLLYLLLPAFFVSGLHAANSTPGKTTLSGKITDKATGSTLPGVTIYVPDLKTGTVSKIDGSYFIDNLPSSKILVQVSFIGYKTIVETIDLSQTTTKDFALETAIKEINEVVVTGMSKASERSHTPTPITLVSKTQLLQNSSSNIIDALSKQPGIDQITTGSGISKPVIRGLGYNRVVVVNDGIRQEGQQWGDEHGIEIDEYGVNRVEILKGPASLSYGSDAIAGVINMLGPTPLPEGKIAGSLLANYQTNNGLIGYSLDLAGTKKGFLWDLRYSNKMAHAYQNNYDGYVYNSGFKENNFGGVIGLNKAWGYSHLHFSSYSLTPGIVEGGRDSASGKFTKPVVVNDTSIEESIAANSDFSSYKPGIPYQTIHHYKAVLNNNFVVGNGSVKATIGFQQNQRKEFADPLNEKDYGLYFLLNTINYDLRYVFPEKDQLSISTGINGMQQTSQNKGTEFLVPAYHLFDIGAFVIMKKSYQKLDLAGGIRYDHRGEKGEDLFLKSNGAVAESTDTNATHRFSAFNANIGGISGSMGATYNFNEKIYVKLNVARGYRAPNIGELAANGEHEGTSRYEIGDPKLNPEYSLQEDVALGINTEHLSFELDGFYNSINDFIYLQKLNSTSGGDSIIDASNPIPTFQYKQGNANLLGGEIRLDIHPHPLDWLHFENSFSYVQSIQTNATDSTKYLPFTPAPKLESELRADIKKAGKLVKNVFVSVQLENYFEQKNVFWAYGTETPTPGYTLLNFGIGGDLQIKNRTRASLFFNVNNALDVAYQSHLSRFKYLDVNNATGRTGVYNMGRNFSIKLIVPFGN